MSTSLSTISLKALADGLQDHVLEVNQNHSESSIPQSLIFIHHQPSDQVAAPPHESNQSPSVPDGRCEEQEDSSVFATETVSCG